MRQQQQHQQAAARATTGSPTSGTRPRRCCGPGEKARAAGEQTPTAPSAEDLQRWRKHCAQLLAEPSPFSNALHLTTCARDALAACGMRRGRQVDGRPHLEQLRVHQTWGLPKDSATLQLTVGQSSVLQRLLAQPAQLRLTPANHAQFCAHLPQSLRALFIGEHLLLRLLVNKARWSCCSSPTRVAARLRTSASRPSAKPRSASKRLSIAIARADPSPIRFSVGGFANLAK